MPRITMHEVTILSGKKSLTWFWIVYESCLINVLVYKDFLFSIPLEEVLDLGSPLY